MESNRRKFIKNSALGTTGVAGEANGLLASREYDEMRHSSLIAFGDVVKQLM